MSDLKLLLKKRGNKTEVKGTGTSQPAVNLPPPPPPPQVSDPALKPMPDLKKKRPMEPEDREVVLPPKAKQQKVAKDHRNERASSVESREEPPMADVHRGQRTWSPRLELDGVPFSWETSVYVAEEWNRKAYVEVQAEAQARSEAKRTLGSLKDEVSQILDQLKGVTQERNSFHAGLRNAETQAEAQRKLLNDAQKNLVAERELVKELRAELLKAKKAAKEAQRDAQLAKEATEAEKKASFQLGVKTTEKNIRALLEADAPPPAQLPEASEQPLVDPTPPVILGPTKGPNLLGDQAPSTEPQQEKDEVLEGEKVPSDPQDQAPTKA
nr:eukaryotic translation initiation factor 5B-like [Quercus suber]